MPCAGFEPTIPASERAKTVHALERSATVTGGYTTYIHGIEVLLERSAVSQPLKKFPALYGTRMFIAVFTRALLTLSDPPML
jgi:hypothetical protein